MTHCIVFDWAGTIVDYGSLAPAKVFVSIFNRYGLDVTLQEVIGPMGLEKRKHIETLLSLDRISQQFQHTYQRPWTQEDVDKLYDLFIKHSKDIIPQYSNPIPGFFEVLDFLKHNNVKIGTTTGYSREILNPLVERMHNLGFQPDSIVTSDEVPKSRPHPDMMFLSAERMDIPKDKIKDIIKIDDTIPGLMEGIHARCITIGIAKTGAMMGLSEDQVLDFEKTDPLGYQNKLQNIRQQMLSSGANYVIDSIADLPVLLKQIWHL